MQGIARRGVGITFDRGELAHGCIALGDGHQRWLGLPLSSGGVFLELPRRLCGKYIDNVKAD
jgi:hypothetical protein